MPRKVSKPHLWYGRLGQPIEFEEWAKLFEQREYHIVAQDAVAGGRYYVSTVWLGIDHSFDMRQKPIIFETMVFRAKKGEAKYGEDIFCQRYSSEAEAIEGHKAAMALFGTPAARLRSYKPFTRLHR